MRKNDGHSGKQRPKPWEKESIPDVIWGGIHGTYETQAISDDTFLQDQTGVAIPRDACVEDSKMWVDFNQK